MHDLVLPQVPDPACALRPPRPVVPTQHVALQRRKDLELAYVERVHAPEPPGGAVADNRELADHQPGRGDAGLEGVGYVGMQVDASEHAADLGAVSKGCELPRGDPEVTHHLRRERRARKVDEDSHGGQRGVGTRPLCSSVPALWTGTTSHGPLDNIWTERSSAKLRIYFAG